MALIKYTDVVTNTRGDSLPDYRVQVVTSAGSEVEIYSDGSGTRFRDAAGNVVNYATASSTGKVEFYWTPATGQILQTLDTGGNLVDTDADFADKFVIANLAGEVPQDQVTNLPADLAAKADATATTAALATKVAAADLASSTGGSGVGLSDGATAQQAIAVAATPADMLALTGSLPAQATIRTANGFVYEVAPAVATDYDLVTAGGAQLYVLPSVEGKVSIEAFGCVGDGPASGIVTTGATDNTAALQKALNWQAKTKMGLVIPGRTFVVDGHLDCVNNASFNYDGLFVEGVGWGLNRPKSRLLFTSTDAEPLWTIGRIAPPDSAALLMSPTIKNIELRVAPTTRGSNPILRFQGVQNWVIDRCYFYGKCDQIDGTWWVGGHVKHTYFRGIAGGTGIISKDLGWGQGNFANVVGHTDCTFDQLDVWHDYRLGGRAIKFTECWVEPVAGYGSAASAGFSGDYETTYDKVWCGDANGTGTWITATGSRVALIECEILQGAVGVYIDTRDVSYVQGGVFSNKDASIRISCSKTSVRNARIACAYDNSVGIHCEQGYDIEIDHNSVYNSGGVTGTIAYKLDAGTRGTLRDKLQASPPVGTLVTNANTNGSWFIDTRQGLMQGGITTTIGSIPIAGSYSFNITVAGAKAGDEVVVVPPAALVDGFTFSGKVAADGAARVTIFNGSGSAGAPAPGSQTWSVRCTQKQF